MYYIAYDNITAIINLILNLVMVMLNICALWVALQKVLPNNA